MEGGRYVLKDGKLERVVDPTEPHPDGDAPRDETGRRLDRPAEAAPAEVIEGAPAPGTKKKGGRDAA